MGYKMQTDTKASAIKRLNRIEGQVRGLAKMIDEDRYCIDVVTQISAVQAALRRVEEEILRDGSGRIQVVETGVVRCATPMIVREILDMDPELRQAVRG